jgi:hypothetical protein
MGIAFPTVYLLAHSIPKLGRPMAGDVLTLGVQDCYFTAEMLKAFFKRHRLPYLQTNIEHTTGFAWDKSREHHSPDYIHQRTLFRMWGFDTVHALDASAFEGADIVHDLNTALSPQRVYDLVFDGGTLEHVFSLKDAFFNIARLCKIGGYAVHMSPTDYIGHGFYNMNACVFREYYVRNGFEEIALCYVASHVAKRLASREMLLIDPAHLHAPIPRHSTLVFAAFRKIANVQLTVPQQGVYTDMWGGAGLAKVRGRSRLKDWIVNNTSIKAWLDPIRTRRLARKIAL